MNYKEFYDKINNNDYKSKLPYPPYRPMQIITERKRKNLIEKDRVMKEEHKADDRRFFVLFREDCKKYIESELEQSITDEQFEQLFQVAWEEGHSSGYNEVLNYVSTYIKMVRPFLNEK